MKQIQVLILLVLTVLLPIASTASDVKASDVDDYLDKLSKLSTSSSPETYSISIDNDQEPIITHESYTVEPYDLYFDLIGVRNLEMKITELEPFTTSKCSGERCSLYLKDLNTDESLELQIIRYDTPRAKQMVYDFTDLNEAGGCVESSYGTCFVCWDMFSGFSAGMEIDEYTFCGVASSMSWKATEMVIKTLRVEADY